MDVNKDVYPNETMRLLCERASCRSFVEKKIPEDVLAAVLRAGTRCASGGNLQPYSVIKVEEPRTRQKLADLCGGQSFISRAPVDLLFCIDWNRLRRWADLEVAPFTATASFRHFWISFQDTVIFAQSVCTAADAMGLGSVYVGSVLESLGDLRQMFNLPQGVFPVVLVSLGYPLHQSPVQRKLGPEVVVHDEVYHDLDDEALLSAFASKYEGRKHEATPERLDRLAAVCTGACGEEFARKALDAVKDRGFITEVQRYFGLHYRANAMPEGNLDYLAEMQEAGFSWFRAFEPERG